MHHTIEHQEHTAAGWKIRRYDLTKPKDMARYIAREKYSWPGGYSLAAITSDGDILCAKCVKDNFRLIANSTKGDGWDVVGMACASDFEDAEYCANCDSEIS